MFRPILRGRSFFAACAAGGLLAGAGCREPNQPMQAAPMGVGVKTQIPEGLEPAVLGEQRASAEGYNPEQKKAEAPAASKDPLPEKPAAEPVTTASGLKYQIYTVGNGPEAKPGQRVTVHYTGTLENGSKFDSSRDRDEPFPFRLGGGEVIKGWDEGVAGMKVGERRVLTIPADLGYGAAGRPPQIPPNSTLIFDVALIAVE